jgi:hypothetical protein
MVNPPGNDPQLPVQHFMLAHLHSLACNTGSELMLGKDQGAKCSNPISDVVVLLPKEENEIM